MPKNNIYITYCSKQKSGCKSEGSKLFLPSELYISSRVQSFIHYCKKHKYTWAIFSDYYGLVFENDKIEWYDKSPELVTSKEYDDLLANSLYKLREYSNIFFFYNIQTFHPIYKRFVKDLERSKKIILVDRLEAYYENTNI